MVQVIIDETDLDFVLYEQFKIDQFQKRNMKDLRVFQ